MLRLFTSFSICRTIIINFQLGHNCRTLCTPLATHGIAGTDTEKPFSKEHIEIRSSVL